MDSNRRSSKTHFEKPNDKHICGLNLFLLTQLLQQTLCSTHHPVPSSPESLRVHLPSSLLVHTNEVTRAWIALVEWFFVFFHTYGSSMLRAVSSMWLGRGKLDFVVSFISVFYNTVFAQCAHHAHTMHQQFFTSLNESQHWKWLHHRTSHDYDSSELTMIRMSLS